MSNIFLKSLSFTLLIFSYATSLFALDEESKRVNEVIQRNYRLQISAYPSQQGIEDAKGEFERRLNKAPELRLSKKIVVQATNSEMFHLQLILEGEKNTKAHADTLMNQHRNSTLPGCFSVPIGVVSGDKKELKFGRFFM